MGYWKDVAYDMSRGMSREIAEKVNAELRYGNLTEEKRKKLIAESEVDVKLNTLK